MRDPFNHRINERHGLKLSDVPALVEYIASKDLAPLDASRLLIIGIDNAFDVPTEPCEDSYGALSCAIGTVEMILDAREGERFYDGCWNSR